MEPLILPPSLSFISSARTAAQNSSTDAPIRMVRLIPETPCFEYGLAPAAPQANRQGRCRSSTAAASCDILPAMRSLVYVAKESVEMQERPRPTLAAGEKELQVELSGICGSDMSGFLGHSPRRKPPLTLGHEVVGRLNDGRRVVANPLISCGKCARCRAGAQNLCDSWRLLGFDGTEGSFAEFVAVPESQLYEIPASLPSERAVLAEPLANAVQDRKSVVEGKGGS